ncbi:hypothetical protein [Streptomyces cellostaticus]|uniref:hypothetical protein n=1 Tax=Streptomyces cellostaticus TaxID=67285 RepID=UPI001FC98557|nr:hypothetical protein [Streptomyces cellostaticus]
MKKTAALSMKTPLPSMLTKLAVASVRLGPGSRRMPRATSQGSRPSTPSADGSSGTRLDAPGDTIPPCLIAGFPDRRVALEGVDGCCLQNRLCAVTTADQGVCGGEDSSEQVRPAREESQEERERFVCRAALKNM